MPAWAYLAESKANLVAILLDVRENSKATTHAFEGVKELSDATACPLPRGFSGVSASPKNHIDTVISFCSIRASHLQVGMRLKHALAIAQPLKA
jgi:hypothetical protein